MTTPSRHSVRHRIGLAVLAVSAIAVPTAGAQTQAEISGKAELLREVNAARTARGLAPLKLSPVLGVPAVRHSRYLARTGLLTHTGADGRAFYHRLYAAGFARTKAVGENLGMIGGCSTDASKLMVKMWLASPGHRRNLLSKHYKVVGLAVVTAPDCAQTVYATDFGG